MNLIMGHELSLLLEVANFYCCFFFTSLNTAQGEDLQYMLLLLIYNTSYYYYFVFIIILYLKFKVYRDL